MAVLALALMPALGQAPPAARASKGRLNFYVAKGKADACGPGCSEWIAVEGFFDTKGGERFGVFLKSLPTPRPPAMFHSPGGSIRASLIIGDLLRDNDMAAAVGKTVVVSKRAGHGPRHAIVHRGAVCNSACVYAFIGATRRDVAPGARLGIHAVRPINGSKPKPEKTELLYVQLRQYAMVKGISVTLVDRAAKTSPNSIHWVSQDELHRYGIVSKKPFETPWQSIKLYQRSLVAKSLTHLDRAAHHTTYIEFSCHAPGFVNMSIERDLTDRELASHSLVQMTWPGGRLWRSQRIDLSYLRSAGTRRHADFSTVELADVLEAADAPSLTLDELFTSPEHKIWSRETQLSTKGMYDALVPMLSKCHNTLPERRRDASK